MLALEIICVHMQNLIIKNLLTFSWILFRAEDRGSMFKIMLGFLQWMYFSLSWSGSCVTLMFLNSSAAFEFDTECRNCSKQSCLIVSTV